MGIYADTGRLIHGNPLFQHEDSATHFLFVSSGSGMWVLTNAESNFEGNLGYVRYASREGYPSAPAQSWTGSAWEPDAALKVSVQACVPLPPDDKYHCFMTHDWGHDMLGRPNHDRVKRVNAAFKAAGLSARAHHTNHRHRALGKRRHRCPRAASYLAQHCPSYPPCSPIEANSARRVVLWSQSTPACA